MRNLSLEVIVFMACVLLSAGCGDTRTGFLLTSDGKVVSDNAVARHDNAVATIERDLQADLGAHWRAKAGITELPVWMEDRDEGDWRCASLNATIELVGDGQAPLPVSEGDIRGAVARFLGTYVDHPSANLHVTVAQAVDAARFAALSGAGAPPASAGTRLAAHGNRSYVVQPKDTIADISIAFYGSAERWRTIVDANPGLDPAALVPGTTVIIPGEP